MTSEFQERSTGPDERSRIEAKIASVPHWYHSFDLGPGLAIKGVNDTPGVLRVLGLPEDCRGLRALDLGTRDGFFAFELKRRGADVVAVDYMPMNRTGFAVARELLQVDVPYTQENIYNLSPETYGTFDLVLFLGLLYHLPDPMAALRIVRRLCKRDMFLETHIIDNALLRADGSSTSLKSVSPELESLPIMQFYPGSSLAGDHSNFWGPNAACMKAMLQENNFEVLSATVAGSRGIFRCRVVEDKRREYLLDTSSGIRSFG